MNQHLQSILTSIQQDKNLSEEEKNAIIKSLKDADKDFEIANFKLDRTEKVKRTTAILLEETIEELEHKRKAVEAQNRELEIESSLERVRAVAMSMMKADDLLKICEVQFNELKQLGFSELRNALIGIFHDDKNYFTDYDYSDFAAGNIHKIPYNMNSLVDRAVMRMKSANDAFTEFIVEGKELEEWKAFRKQNGEYDDTRIENADVLYYYFYSINSGNIGISTFSKISDNQLTILKRFRNVFDLAYKRYVDITNAAAQAHEAKIEASLERMRAVAMSMQKSDEIIHVSESMYKELTALGFTNIRNAQIAIQNETKQAYTVFEYSDFAVSKGEAAYNSSPMVAELYNELGKAKDAFYQKEFSGKKFIDWREWRKSLQATSDSRIDSAESVCFYLYSFGTGHLGISTFNSISEEQIAILKRFKKVFELSYQRYTDVAKAEAQAKEAQIELALERVRARTMAMQKSDELGETAWVLFQQFEELGEDPEQIGIGIMNEEERVMELSSTINGKLRDHAVKVPVDEPILINKLYKAWKEDKKSFIVDITGKDLEDYNKFRNSLANIKIDINRTKDRRVVSAAYFSKGLISLATTEPRPAETLQLLERFASVFDLTYTRFLDLKQAEAQARESQIQLALERVRARTMAMQKSDELLETSLELFQQLKELGEPAEQLTIGVIKEDEGIVEVSATLKGSKLLQSFKHDINEPYVMNKMFKAWKARKKTLVIEQQWEELIEYNKVRNKLVQSDMFPVDLKPGDQRLLYVAFYSKGTLALSSNEPRPKETLELLERFAKVFDQTYTRFLDLKNAEAQTKESQIQLALERVRARTMAMQKSDELAETAVLLFHQLMSLGLNLRGCGFNIWEKNEKTCTAWMSGPDGTLSQPFNLPLTEDPFFIRYYESRLKGEDFWVYETGKEELAARYKYLRTLPGLGERLAKDEEEGMETELPPFIVDHVVNFSNGNLIFITYNRYPEAWDIFKRFGKVFEQTYTRFLDLQKAETQAREAKIEAALERTRTQSMIMQHSTELDDTLRVFHEQVLLLGITSAFSFLWLPDEDKDRHIFWAAWKENENDLTIFKSKAINYPLDRNEPATAQCLIDWKGIEPIVSYHVPPTGVASYFAAWQELINGVEQLKPEHFSGGLYYVEAFMKYGCFGVMVTTDLTEDEKKILGRFAIEFERTYRRFLDLQKAEAQTREAQIEAALEKVRSRSLAMHQSNELEDVIMVVSEQLLQLQFRFHNVSFSSTNEQRETTFWLATPGRPHPYLIQLPYIDTTMLTRVFEAREKGVEFLADIITTEQNQEWLQHLVYKSRHSFSEEDEKYLLTLKGLARSTVLTKHIILAIINYAIVPYTEEQNTILKRFGNVFEQAYTRFLDLKKAEAQSRESKIEASLERVRSKAMSMQKSEDLAAAITIVFEELYKLDLGMLRCGMGILNKEKRTADVWTTTIADNNTIVQVSGDESMDIHPLLSGAFDAWLNKEDHSYTLKGEDLNNYYKAVAGENFKLPDSQSLISKTEGIEQYYFNAVFSAGGLFAFRKSPFPEEAKTILRRFADVFTLTYTRFSDLKQAEAQAKEAKIEVALERVRSRTLAMQKSDELAETAAVLFRQLILLGIQPNRLYIAIVKNETGTTEFWITDEDGSQVSSAFETNLNDNPTFQRMFNGWKTEKKSLVIDMQGDELQEYFKYLTSIHVPFKGGLTQKRRLQDIAYFSKGFIGMASPEELPAETLQLLERFAAVFNLTYTRFNDLQVSEAHAIQAEQDLIAIKEAKQKAEDTLTELQSAQKQLIQSEKMASLGELTAGIAHEIQNPLNFVNNFSEVSVELIQEMVDEVEKGNNEEAKAIADDLIQNLEKINHHGKRADAIVKGMLQHSRTTSTTKEPTDINKLADEYLRLAYHGLRAKDKSFNATLKTDYNERIDKINVIPQDMGRVILNLITNAFYAVAEKKKQTPNNYEPTVTVKTSQTPPSEGRGISITVSDNGNGIPQNIVAKIFQPFFTTKPTGQGTGLGLSLAYDIVKAHGGELKVETKEREGSIFIIQLPFNA